MDAAITKLAQARELDPLTPYISSTLAYLYHLARRPDEAIVQLQRMIALDPNFIVARYTLGQAYEQKGRYEQALAEFNEAQRLDQQGWVPQAFLAHTYAVSGKPDEARRRLAELEQSAQQRHIDAYSIGVIYAGLREKERAFEWFEKSYQARSEELLFIKVDPRIDSLRADPRYADLLRRLQLAP
jgi:eukaryotic-like serine/threonine-protein kinase